MTIHPLQAVAGVPESHLHNAVAALLPPSSPPAPWTVAADVVIWVHRAAPGAAALLPGPLRRVRTLPLTLAAFVRYSDTPVGPYAELLASPVALLEAPRLAGVAPRRGGTVLGAPALAGSVPFIAVDSVASIHAGRTAWALPKTLARFAFERGRAEASGVGWRVEASLRVRTRRAFPLDLTLRDRQARPDGTTVDVAVGLAGRARVGRVTVDADGPTLSRWLRPGSHLALVVPGARMTVGVPAPRELRVSR